jgi:hypothetical protein
VLLSMFDDNTPSSPSLPPSLPRRLWSVSPGQDKEGKELQVFTGHAARLASCAFHPCGRYLGTTSWDYTWRYAALPPSLPPSLSSVLLLDQ